MVAFETIGKIKRAERSCVTIMCQNQTHNQTVKSKYFSMHCSSDGSCQASIGWAAEVDGP